MTTPTSYITVLRVQSDNWVHQSPRFIERVGYPRNLAGAQKVHFLPPSCLTLVCGNLIGRLKSIWKK